MGKIYDFRLITIKDEDDILEFVDLIVAKAPQIAQVLKNLKFQRVSLENRIAQAPRVAANKPNADATVLDQLTGKAERTATPAQSESDQRLAQMRNAQSAPATPTTDPVKPTEDDDALPPAPVKPGEIGQLAVPDVDPKAPDASTPADLPDASGNIPGQFPVPDASGQLPVSFTTQGVKYETNLRGTPPEGTDYFKDGEPIEKSDYAAAYQQSIVDASQDDAVISEEDAAKAAGSKSEHAPDDGVQSSDTEGEELSDEAKAALEADPVAGTPTAADLETVGSKAARKGTAGKRKK